MTRRDYIALAAVLKANQPHVPAPAYRALVGDLADMLRADNPHFDRARFYSACGLAGAGQ